MGVFSKYLGTIGGVFYDNPIAVIDLTISRGPYYVGLWNSTKLGPGKYGKTFGDEYDIYAGWSHDFGDLRYEVTAMYFLIADLARLNDDLWVIDQKLSLPKCLGASPYVKVRCFNRVGSNSPEGGLFLWAGLSRTLETDIKLRGRTLTIDLDGTTAYSDGPLGKTPGAVFARLTLGASIPIMATPTLRPSVVIQTPISGHEKVAHPLTTKTEVVWGLTLNTTF